jgi:hypothetical protein
MLASGFGFSHPERCEESLQIYTNPTLWNNADLPFEAALKFGLRCVLNGLT